MTTEPVNIVCMRWGTRYSPDYVHNLYAGIQRHLSRPFRFLCVTNEPDVLDAAIDTHPIPPNPGVTGSDWPNVFLKLELLRDGFADLHGPTLFMDLDVIVMGSMDDFFTFQPGKNCIIHNWIDFRKTILRPKPDVGNSSLFRFEAGRSQYIHDTFMREVERVNDRSIYPTEQAFLTYAMKEKYYWPDAWVKSFKRHCRPPFPLNLLFTPWKPPSDTRVLVFHGFPDPHTAADGFTGGRLSRRVKPTPWVPELWSR